MPPFWTSPHVGRKPKLPPTQESHLKEHVYKLEGLLYFCGANRNHLTSRLKKTAQQHRPENHIQTNCGLRTTGLPTPVFPVFGQDQWDAHPQHGLITFEGSLSQRDPKTNDKTTNGSKGEEKGRNTWCHRPRTEIEESLAQGKHAAKLRIKYKEYDGS